MARQIRKLRWLLVSAVVLASAVLGGAANWPHG